MAAPFLIYTLQQSWSIEGGGGGVLSNGPAQKSESDCLSILTASLQRQQKMRRLVTDRKETGQENLGDIMYLCDDILHHVINSGTHFCRSNSQNLYVSWLQRVRIMPLFNKNFHIDNHGWKQK